MVRTSGVTKHACCFFDFNPAWGLSEIKAVEVDVGQSFKTFGYGCSSCWGDVGAGDAEVGIINISFIVSVQHIGYLISYKDKVQVDN